MSFGQRLRGLRRDLDLSQAEIADRSGHIIGRITSGGFGPSINAPIAMGYAESAFAIDGTEIDLIVRGKAMPARVAPMPFVPHSYKRAANPN